MKNLFKTIKFNLVTRPVMEIFRWKYCIKWVKIGNQKGMTLERMARLARFDYKHSMYLLMKKPKWSWLF